MPTRQTRRRSLTSSKKRGSSDGQNEFIRSRSSTLAVLTARGDSLSAQRNAVATARAGAFEESELVERTKVRGKCCAATAKGGSGAPPDVRRHVEETDVGMFDARGEHSVLYSSDGVHI